MPACGYPQAGMLLLQKLCQRLPCRLFRLPGKKTAAGKFSVEIKCQKSYSVFIVRSIFSINRKDRRCPSPRRRVKRETGVNPVRTRHCKWGTRAELSLAGSGREDGLNVMIHKPGNLPAVPESAGPRGIGRAEWSCFAEGGFMALSGMLSSVGKLFFCRIFVSGGFI